MHLLDNRLHLSRAIANIGWLFADNAVRMLVGLLVGAWVARYLGPTQVGQLNYAISIVAIFAAFASLGLNGAVVKRIITVADRKAETLGTAFIMQVIGGFAATSMVLLVVSFRQQRDDVALTLAAILGSALVFKSSDVFKYWFESSVRSKYSVVAEGAAFIVCSLIKAFLIMTGAALLAFAWVSLLEALLSLLGLALIYNKSGESFHNWKCNLKTARELFLTAWPVILSSILVALNFHADKLFLMSLSGPTELGLYSAASTLVSMWFFVPVAVGSTIAPYLTRIHRISLEKYLKLSRSAYLWFAGGSLVISTVVCLASDTIILLLFGHSFENASKLLSIMTWGIVFVSIVSLRGRLLIIEENPTYVAKLIFFGVASNASLLAILTPHYGPTGAAFAYVVSWGLNALAFPLLNKHTRRHGLMALGFSGMRNEH